MEEYVKTVLDPVNHISGAPSPFQQKTTVFRANGMFTLTSSLANGHVLCAINPQYVTSNNAAFLNRYADGPSALDVYSLPTIANLTNTQASGGSYSQFTFLRMVAFQVTLRYIGAELTQSGELSAGIDNGSPITVGVNVKSYIQDCIWQTAGDSDAVYTVTWVPQDYTDFEYRSYASVAKSSAWGNIVIAGSGFPVNTNVYDCRWTAIIEGMASPSGSDYISRLPSLLGTIEEGCIMLFNTINQRKGLVCGNTHEKHIYFPRLVAAPQKVEIPSNPWDTYQSETRPHYDPTSGQSYSDYLNEGRPLGPS